MNDYFEKLISDRTQSANVLEKPSMQGIKMSVVEKYSERAHFIFELIQNADDAKATYIKFKLNQDGLYFTHNGKINFHVSNPDTEEEDKKNNRLGHINAITSIGQSSKTENEIGKFGVGFKAVFQYCETPEIYENEYKFRLERFIIPTKIENDHSERLNGETLFFFPFNNPNTSQEIAFSDISQKIKGLLNPLLFVNSLTEIKWDIKFDNSIESGIYSKEIKEEIQYGNINLKTVTQHLKKSNELHPISQTALIFSSTIQREENTFDYSVVYFLEQEKKIDYTKEYPLYCYFPTQKVTKLKFIIQAPFLLVDNRQDIKHNDWNEYLIKLLGELVADSISIFKQREYLNDDLFNVFPIKEENFKNTLFSTIYDSVLNKLRSDEELLPTKEGGFTNYGYCYLSDTDRILNLFSSEQLADLLQEPNAKWIFSSMYGTRRRRSDLSDYVVNNFIKKELLPRDIIDKTRANFIEKQTDEWLIRFYEVFSNVKDTWDLCRNRPIIRTDKDENITPFNVSKELQVFLPTKIDSEYPTVKRIFIENEKVQEFFVNLGLREPDLKAEVENKIFPRYEKGETKDVKTLVNDFEFFYKYYVNCPQHEVDQFISRLRKTSFILVDIPQKNGIYIAIPTQVYHKTELLENYFESYSQNLLHWFRESEYKAIYNTYGEHEVKLFLNKLGVESKPRKITIDITNKSHLYGLNLTNGTRRFYIHDYDIEGLDNLLNDISFNKSLLLWKILTELYEVDYYFFSGENKYFYYSTNYESFNSKILRSLLNTHWLFTDDDKINPQKPSEIYLKNISRSYDIKSENAQKIISKLIFKKPTEQEKEEWEKHWTPDIKKQLFEHYQKTKEVTDEDLDELNRIKKKRLLLNKSGSPRPTKKGKPLDEIDESELLDLYALRDLTLNIEHVLKFPFSSIKRTIDDLVDNLDDVDLAELKYSLSSVMFSINQWEKGLDFVISFAPNVNKLYSEIDITEIIKYVFLSKNSRLLEEENIFTILELPEKCTLIYQRNYFEDIISNLLDNSIKALKFKEDKKTIKCKIDISNDDLAIFFSDNGIGINDNEKDEIFTMYKTKTKDLGGLGIGLYIVRTRLASINGSIEVIENEFKPTGATFKITIPLEND